MKSPNDLMRLPRTVLARIAPLRALVRAWFRLWKPEPSMSWLLPAGTPPLDGRPPENDLERYFAANQGRMLNKWGHYFGVYDRHFARYRDTDVHILEFGVSHGGSLDMWREYFGPRARLWGVDIDPGCAALAGPGVEILIGDQADRRFLRSLATHIPRIDILIDDGGHTVRQQIATFEELFPRIAPDGVYLCEDMHTSYWKRYGGGVRRRGSFVEYSKRLIDQMNAWHSERLLRLRVNAFTRSTRSMHFYDSMLVIEKGIVKQPYYQQIGNPSSGVDTR